LNGRPFRVIRERKHAFSLDFSQTAMYNLNSQVVAVVTNERNHEVNAEFLSLEDPEKTVWSPIEREVKINGNKGHIGILYSLNAHRVRGTVECSSNCDIYLLNKESYQNVCFICKSYLDDNWETFQVYSRIDKHKNDEISNLG
jgi:hypothetical protein